MGSSQKPKPKNKQASKNPIINRRDLIIIIISVLLATVLQQVCPRIYDALREAKPETRVLCQIVELGEHFVTIDNIGDKADRITINVDIAGAGIITDWKTREGAPIKLLCGGPNGNFANFLVDDLMPDTYQYINIFHTGSGIEKITAWSEITGEIHDITIFNEPIFRIENITPTISTQPSE